MSRKRSPAPSRISEGHPFPLGATWDGLVKGNEITVGESVR